MGIYLREANGVQGLRSYTWANRPSAASVTTGARIRISDIGPTNRLGSDWYSDGTNWRPVGDHVIIGGSVTEVGFSNISPNTTQNVHRSITLPAGIILAGCLAEVRAKWSHTASTNAKNLRLYVGGTSGALVAQYGNSGAGLITTDVFWAVDFITSAGGAGTQLGNANGSTGTGTSANTQYTGSVNTTAATTLDLVSNMAATNETVTLKSFTAMLRYR